MSAINKFRPIRCILHDDGKQTNTKNSERLRRRIWRRRGGFVCPPRDGVVSGDLVRSHKALVYANFSSEIGNVSGILLLKG